MPPVVYNPASGTPFPRTGGTIYWYNGHGSHAPKNATSWRLLVGSTSYGEDYHSGNSIPAGNPLRDNVFNRAKPPAGKTCYVVPQYTLSGGGTSYGTITTFVAN
jgi:hypothetical protein